MGSMVFKARSILRLDGDFISEHGRAPLSVSFNQIEQASRMAKGDLRVYQVAKKHKLSTSWELLPSRDAYTVDGYMGGTTLYSLYMNSGEIRVEIWTDAEAAKTERYATIDFQGRVSSFSYTIEKRNLGGIFYDFWNVNIEIEEI